MTQSKYRHALRGFTLIEMVITLALVGLVSMFAVPLYEMAATRYKEAELRQALRTIRGGIDAYKSATDTGILAKDAGESGYPPTLNHLIEPQELVGKASFTDTIAAQRIVFLRQLPRDPFNNDADATAAETWNTRAYASRPDDPQPGDDVFDVSSPSERTALDGTRYANW